MTGRRQTERIFIRIPIEARGVDVLGKAFVEKTATVVINRDGARIRMANNPHFGDKLEITNLSNRSNALFEVVAPCPQSYTGAPEWGVEFVERMPDFWGIAFELKKKDEGLAASALLSCKGCNGREMVNLSADDYQAFEKAYALSRQCAQCATVTTWEVAATEAEISALAPEIGRAHV